VTPVLEPLGYQQGWGVATLARIPKEIPDDVVRLTPHQQNIDELVTCGGLWLGREIATEIQVHVNLLCRELMVRGFKEYIETDIGEALKSIDFSAISGYRSKI
jgi:hypothetical protein